MGRVILVSNRLPVTILKSENAETSIRRSDGGLVTGLEWFHASHNSLWIGSISVPLDDKLSRELAARKLKAVEIPETLYLLHYEGFCNSELWPLFHEMPEQMRHTATWGAYRAVNHLFAQAILQEVGEGDIVWVHDYHLMSLPALLRQARPDLMIGFFLHIPFPPFETLQTLPQAPVIVEGLLGADAIGFHTRGYVQNFAAAASAFGFRVEDDFVFHNGRRTRLQVAPLGVDAQGICKRMRTPANEERLQKLQERYRGRKVIVGGDRLDYTKGIPERLRAFREFLHRHPEWLGRVKFVQLTVPSRQNIPEYQALQKEVEGLISEIIGEFGPESIEYHFKSYDQDTLWNFYRLADVIVVNPFRDGLNLVPKEYAAIKFGEPGAIVLSKNAGVAEEFTDALLIDPFDEEEIVRGIERALAMPEAEKIAMMKALWKRLLTNTSQAWSTRCLAAIDEVNAMNAEEVR